MRRLKRDRPIVAGNWKMNGLGRDLDEVDAIERLAAGHPEVCVALAPPVTLLRDAAARATALVMGAQDAHTCDAGAHTGCVSPAMLADAGAAFAILGHSERRQNQGETDALVREKAEAVLAAGLQAIVCVGETLAQRDGGGAQAVGRGPARRVAARGAGRGGGRLRTRLGDRHRTQRRRGSDRRHARPHPRRAGRAGRSGGCRSSMADRSSPTTRARSCTWPTSAARWSAAPA